MQMAIAFLVVLLAGLATAVEAPTNALLARNVASVVFMSFLVAVLGVMVSGVALLIMRPQLQAAWATTTPWYVFLGGVYGTLVIIASAWATPKLGAGTALVVLVAAQVVLGVVLDNYALLGLEPHPWSVLRIAGCVVAIGGALMVSLG